MTMSIDLGRRYQETLEALRQAELRAAELRGRLALLEELIRESQAVRSDGEAEPEP